MYYSSGNYEAFARPLKPEGIEHKSAYFVGTGLAALSAGCFLVRDAQMPGKNIHFFDRDPIAGGACDGWNYPEIGYVMRGGREMDNHFEVMWDLFRSIPSIETEGASVLDEYYWLNKADPNYSLCRVTEKRGQNAHTDGKRKAHHGCAGCRGSEQQLLDILEDDVRVLRLQQCSGNEALHAALHPPHRRPARPPGTAFHKVQSV